MGELVVKTCFFDTSLFRNIKWVIFALSWSFYSMWMKVEGGQNNQAELIWSEYTGNCQFIEGKKKKFFFSYTADWLMFFRYHMAYFWVHSRAILLYLCERKRKKEKWSVTLVQALLQRQCHTCWVSGPSANLAHAGINTECKKGSRSNTVASSSCLHCNSKHYSVVYFGDSKSQNCLPQVNICH